MRDLISDRSSFSDRQLGVSRKHDYFDLEKFLKGGYKVDAAIMLVTPVQVVMTDCYVINPYMSFYTHEDTMKEVYNSIYEDSSIKNKNWDMVWPNEVILDNNICLQMCKGIGRDHSSDSVFSIPNVISESQYLFMSSFNDYIKDIYMSDKDYFDKFPMVFKFNMNNGKICDSVSSNNNIDVIMDDLRLRVGDVKCNDSYLIGSSINSYKMNMVKGR